MNLAASETNHATAPATSSGARSPIGNAFCWVANQGSCAAARPMVASLTIMSVATPLGWMVLTRIECCAS